MMRSVFVLFLWVCCCNLVLAFDYDSYKKTTLSSIVTESDVIIDSHGEDLGLEILTPMRAVSFSNQILSLPAPCDTNALFQILVMQGHERNSLPAVSFCLEIENESGQSAVMYVQDRLVSAMQSELIAGDVITTWSVWVFSNGFDRKPYLLLNAYRKGLPDA